MDFKARELVWLTQINEVFSDNPVILNANGQNVQKQIIKLKNLLYKRTKLWWNKNFLENYLSKGIIPRGLRVQVFPSYPVDDPIFKNKWEEHANKCSRGFMKLLVLANSSSLNDLEKEIEVLQNDIKKNLSSAELEKVNIELEQQYLKWETEISAMKKKKYQRDNMDVQLNRVYRWRQVRDRTQIPLRSRSSSVVSLSSTDESQSSVDIRPRVKTNYRQHNPQHRAAELRREKRKMSPPTTRGKKTKNNELINLSTHILSEEQQYILSKGLNFSPTNSFDYFTALKDLNLFSCKLLLRRLHAKRDQLLSTPEEREAIQILEELLAEQGGEQDVYRKPTATNLLLHAASSHTPSTIKAIPTGQFLRIRRICSSDDDFKKQSAILTERFLQRGYSRRSLKKAYQKAQHVHREDLLQGRKKVTNKQSDNVRFISTYNCRWEQMRSCIQKNWAILQTDSLVAATLPPRVQMTARRSRNLRDMLVRSHYIANTPNLFGSKGPRVGCYPCGSCRACTNIQRATDFLSADGSRRYQIRQYISCTSTFVIYYATCGCSKIYIRLTSRELRIRTREHVRDILATKEEDDVTHLKTLPRHFNLPGGMILSGNLYQKRYNFFN
ncbi:uncharacterized protein LOC130313384 isoform X3 [Hyla sarda]|uniref:uncharacterized protein LOC130313384 isoform X3 n=1 Tax=Hyla sarda TaxID=327740 RepID=UPI0024C2D765|nr:uncharacterized protein LOC130313384 isoform X3 [Hyla sarda]